MTDATLDAAELKRLHEQATPGPWKVETGVILAADDEFITDCQSSKWADDNSLITYLRNNVPAILALQAQLDAVKEWAVRLYCASGCSCCRDDDAWDEAEVKLGELLGLPAYTDGSGFDFYAARDAILAKQGGSDHG